MAEQLNAKDLGAVGDGITDDTARLQDAVNLAITSQQSLFIPSGRYLVSKALNIRRGVRIYGCYAEPQVRQFTPEVQRGAGGTWFVLDGTHLTSVFNIAPNGAPSSTNQAYGVELSHFGIVHTHPAPAPGWAPANYPAAFLLAGASDIHIYDVTVLCPTIGFQATTEGGRITIERVRGQPLSHAMVFDNQLDVVRVNDCHFWVYWSLDPSVIAWQKANGSVYRLGRIDNPVFSNNFAIWYHIGVEVVRTATGNAGLCSFIGCGWDTCGYLCVINDAGNSHDLMFTGGYAQGDPDISPGASAVLVCGDVNSSVITFANFRFQGYPTQVIYLAGPGTGNRVLATGCVLLDWDEANGRHPAIYAAPGNQVVLDATTLLLNGHGAPKRGGPGSALILPITARGTATLTGPATEVTVPHSLGRKPDAVILTPNGPQDVGRFWSTATEHDFTVHIQKPAGTPMDFDALLILDGLV